MCESPRDPHSHMWVVCREVLYIHSILNWKPLLDEIEIGPKSMIACVCICMTPYSGLTY